MAPLIDEFEQVWRQIDAYEQRSTGSGTLEGQAVINAALAFVDHLMNQSKLPESAYVLRRAELEEDLARVTLAYYKAEAARS